MRSIGQNSIFLEHGHVAYQNKGNHEMQQHGSKSFARRPPSPRTLGDGVKRSKLTLSEHGHVVLKGIMNAVTW